MRDFSVGLGANHSDRRPIARIGNDEWQEKIYFYISLFVSLGTKSLIAFPCLMHAASAPKIQPRRFQKEGQSLFT
jgi:hypothetical protein